MAEIVPAILTNDIADFKLKYGQLLALGQYFKKLHIDFIDGEFLPNATLMPADLKFIKSPFQLVAHFMTLDPAKYFDDAKQVGFVWAIIHFEAFPDVKDLLSTIEKAKEKGLKIGLAINPETPLHKAAKVLLKVDLVQLMGVHPGAQGRSFEMSTLAKIKELKALLGNVIIAVDGGERLGIVSKSIKAGADLIVIGSGILHATHPKEALEAFNREMELI